MFKSVFAAVGLLAAWSAPAAAEMVDECVNLQEQFHFNGPNSPLQTVDVYFETKFDDSANAHPIAFDISSNLGDPVSVALTYQYEGYPTDIGMLTAVVDDQVNGKEYTFFMDNFPGSYPCLCEWAMDGAGATGTQGGPMIAAGFLAVQNVPEPGTAGVVAVALCATLGLYGRRAARRRSA